MEDITVSLGELLPRQLWGDLVKWRAGYQCEDCGSAKETLRLRGQSGELHAHHVDKNLRNNRLSNGKCLCPSCHQTIHARDAVGRPCSKGCTCNRHRKPSLPFGAPGQIAGGSEQCRPGCKCNRHKARYYGAYRFEQPCVKCGRATKRVTPGLCATCSHNAWYHRNRERVNLARRRA